MQSHELCKFQARKLKHGENISYFLSILYRKLSLFSKKKQICNLADIKYDQLFLKITAKLNNISRHVFDDST
jgi:hypothetical protein